MFIVAQFIVTEKKLEQRNGWIKHVATEKYDSNLSMYDLEGYPYTRDIVEKSKQCI